MGLDDVLRARGDRFFGILNGLDTDLWNPATDAALAAPYSRDDRVGQGRLPGGPPRPSWGSIRPTRPVLGDDRPARPPEGLRPARRGGAGAPRAGLRLIVQGWARPSTLDALRALAAAQQTRDEVALVERFDRDLARRIYAGADGFLMPSRFEPCGTGPDDRDALRHAADRARHRAACATRSSTRPPTRARARASPSRARRPRTSSRRARNSGRMLT